LSFITPISSPLKPPTGALRHGIYTWGTLLLPFTMTLLFDPAAGSALAFCPVLPSFPSPSIHSSCLSDHVLPALNTVTPACIPLPRSISLSPSLSSLPITTPHPIAMLCSASNPPSGPSPFLCSTRISLPLSQFTPPISLTHHSTPPLVSSSQRVLAQPAFDLSRSPNY
jgi:hypothetical protein